MSKAEKKRLFIGIPLPNQLKKEISEAKAKAEEYINGRWIKVENIHLTLKFLGYCEVEIINQINEAVAAAVSREQAFNLSTTEFGCFPKKERARIVWLGLERDDRLDRIQSGIEEGLAALGFEKEDRKYHPHLTVVRCKKPVNVDLDAVNNLVKIRTKMPVNAVNLYESVLTREGAEYVKLNKFELLA